jgi:hypothetical protein
MNLKRWRSRLVAGVFAALLACAGTRPAWSQDAGTGVSATSEVVLYALGFIGVPYRYGGEDPERGFDCSGFVRHVFRGVPGVDLPRTSAAMSRSGRRVDRAALAPGDLVFFNTLGRQFSHVGIYLGDGRFVHAPAQRGQVRIETMNETYWRVRYNGARRLIPEDGGAVVADAARPLAPPASARPATPAVTPANDGEDPMPARTRTGPQGEGP